MDDPVVDAVYGLLVNRVDAYLAVDPRTRTWYCRKAPLKLPLIQAAVHGHTSLGLYAVSAAGTSKWLCLDVDTSTEVPTLYRLATRLVGQGNVLLEHSRRGAHLWLCGPPTPWEQVHAYGQLLARDAGLGLVEIFPKGGGLHGVKVPGSRHPKSGMVYPAINPTTGELLDVGQALVAIRPQPFPVVNLQRDVAVRPMRPRHADCFWALVQELSTLTRLRVCGQEKAIGRCPWHDDRHPSLFVKGSRFHCLAHSCGCWGDVADVRRFVHRGIIPPKR